MHFSTSVFQQSSRNTFPCFTSEKDYARLLTEALSGHTQSSPSSSLLDTQLSHDQNTGLRQPVGGVGCAVPGWRCSCQPQVLVFWSHDSSVPGSAAEEQPQDSAGREQARNGMNCSGCCPPLACSTFFLNYRHFWWLKMEMQKSCPDFCLYWLGKYIPGYNMA